MIQYHIDNMTCDNCVRHVTRAVQALAPAAKIEADLPGRSVRIDADVDEAALRRALGDAGYAPREE